MIHSARPIVTPVANIVFCCFVFLDLKSGDGRTDNMCKTMIPTGRDFGLAEWIKNEMINNEIAPDRNKTKLPVGCELMKRGANDFIFLPFPANRIEKS